LDIKLSVFGYEPKFPVRIELLMPQWKVWLAALIFGGCPKSKKAAFWKINCKVWK